VQSLLSLSLSLSTELILDTQDDLNKAVVYPLAWLAFVGYSLVTVLCASALVVYWQVC
jgi:hypothetical protein